MWDSDSCSWTIDRQKINYYLEKDGSGGTGGTEMHRCASYSVLTELAGGDGSDRKEERPGICEPLQHLEGMKET